MDQSKCEVIDVSDCFVEDSLPTNSQMFGMTNIANALTTRTVQSFISWLTPFGECSKSDKTENSKTAFDKFKKTVIDIENTIIKMNNNDDKEEKDKRFEYVHLLPSNIDISLSI